MQQKEVTIHTEQCRKERKSDQNERAKGYAAQRLPFRAFVYCIQYTRAETQEVKTGVAAKTPRRSTC